MIRVSLTQVNLTNHDENIINILLSDDPPAPYFTPTTQRTQINENIEVGSRFYRMKAYDPDTESETSLSYKIVGVEGIDRDGQPMDQSHPRISIVNNFFAVERITGDLLVHTKINRDVAAVVSLNISVTDVSSTTGSKPQVAYGNLIITIIDHNDHPPIFGKPWSIERPELSVTTLEEQPIGTVLMNLIATDQDSDISHYEIHPASAYFEVGSKSGVITIKKVIDYETIVKESPPELDLRTPKLPNQLRFQVLAYDSGIPQLSCMSIIHVNVVNINDNEPIFNQSSYRASIKENIASGAFVAQVKAVDADVGKYGKISYSIISVSGYGGDDEDSIKSYFIISNDTGVIRVGPFAKIDRENGPQKLTLQVAASDDINGSNNSGGPRRMISVPIYISIEDVNDNKPKFSQREYDATTLGHADGSSTRIPVIQITASDPDDGINGQVSYKIISGNINGVFEIDSISGLISVSKAPLDINPDVTEYKLIVEARDENGLGPYSDESVVKVKVIQVNRHKPKFLFPSTPFIEFYENQKPGTKVVRIQAYDEDSGHNGIVKFSFKINGSKNTQETDDFKIDPDTGLIITKKSLDRESVAKYELVLSAADFMAEPQSFETLQQLTIYIKDLDDNKPKFSRKYPSSAHSLEPTYIFSVYENQPRGSFVGKIQATDDDLDEDHSRIYYHIIDGNLDPLFHLDKLTGILYANTSFDRETQDTYELIVKSSPKESLSYYVRSPDDHDSSNHDSTRDINIRDRSYNPDDLSLAYLLIRINDVNDNKPIYPKNIYRSGISFKADIGTIVSNLKAIDTDFGINSSLTYTLSSIDLYRKGYDTLDSPVRPIPSPFRYTDEGEIEATQLMSQYPIGSRFVLNLEAKEKSPPHRMAHTKHHIWIFDPQKLIKITVKIRPDVVNNKSDEIESIISSATDYRAIIHEIKYHYDQRKGKLFKEWSDLYVLVVDERSFSEVHPARVISKLDSNEDLHKRDNNAIMIEQISLASTSSSSSSIYLDNYDELDFTTIVFFSLILLMSIGFVSMGVSYCCLKSWYQQKLLKESVKAVNKAKILAMKEREAALSGFRDSTLGLHHDAISTGHLDPDDTTHHDDDLTAANTGRKTPVSLKHDNKSNSRSLM